jgi:tetratricopeptide (TPR) repeat protein
MGAEVQIAFPAAVTLGRPRSLQSFADTVLHAVVRFWFAVAVVGQLIFAFTVASFYGMASVRGDLLAWNKGMAHGYVSGDTMGNFAVAVHLFSAVAIILAGVIQLIPRIRERAPSFHRWNGRLYLLTAFTISLAGLYMMWVRGSVGDIWQHLGQSLNAVLIMLCAVMALRYALARDFTTHRRWALRLYLVVSASLFIRAGFFLALFLNHGPFGFDPATFSGPFLTFMSFAQYLVPLAVLEIYFRAQARAAAAGRFAMAAGLFVLTVAMGAGIFAVTMGVWLPRVKAAYDSRKSIAETLSATIASSGIDQAVSQYHELKAAAPAIYNFDEDELNNLGYQLIKTKKFTEAILIFQLNVEAYPQSGNVYDSLGEAYMDDGDKPLAIANYQKSLQLNPENVNAVKRLQKLSAP